MPRNGGTHPANVAVTRGSKCLRPLDGCLWGSGSRYRGYSITRDSFATSAPLGKEHTLRVGFFVTAGHHVVHLQRCWNLAGPTVEDICLLAISSIVFSTLFACAPCESGSLGRDDSGFVATVILWWQKYLRQMQLEPAQPHTR